MFRVEMLKLQINKILIYLWYILLFYIILFSPVYDAITLYFIKSVFLKDNITYVFMYVQTINSKQ